MNDPENVGNDSIHPPVDDLLVEDPNMDLPAALVEELSRALQAINEFHDIVGGDGSAYWTTSAFHDDAILFEGDTPAECARLAAFASFDHLHYFARYSVETKRTSAFAPFTVVRSALTAAATSAWILEDRDPKERRLRALIYRYQDAINQRNAAAAIVSVPRPSEPSSQFDSRHRAAVSSQKEANLALAKVSADAQRCQIDSSEYKRKPHDIDIINLGSKLTGDHELFNDFGITPEMLLHWRSLSASAHGQSWAARMTAKEDVNDDGIPVSRWSPSHDLLMAGYRITWQTLYGMWERYGELARPTQQEAGETLDGTQHL